MSIFLVSLDFEFFWGVSESRTVSEYGRNILGEWEAVPELLKLFDKYGINATWATVGMLMCRDYRQWKEIAPRCLPEYKNKKLSNYKIDAIVKDNPRIFFGRPLVQRILETPGQEIGGHSYSHFYCSESGVNPEQFSADLECARYIADDIGVSLRSFVFPRNQSSNEYVKVLGEHGYMSYRGNPDSWIYKNGHEVDFGYLGRCIRGVDSYFSFADISNKEIKINEGLFNCKASLFLRPYSRKFSVVEQIRLRRIKKAMLAAAINNELFHLWWHPHNFGVNLDLNIAFLEEILVFFRELNEKYGMVSLTMSDSVQGKGL